MLVSPDIPLQLGVDSRQQFCLQSLPSMERLPLQYTVCVARDVKAAHQEAVQQLSQHSRELPNMKALWLVRFLFFLFWIHISRDEEGACQNTRESVGPASAERNFVGVVANLKKHVQVFLTTPPPRVSYRLPFWKLLANVDSGQKVERELRTFSNRLKRHQLGEGVISLNEHSTTLLSDMVRAPRRVPYRAVIFKSPASASSAGRRGFILKTYFRGTNLEKRDRSLMLDVKQSERWQSCSSKT